MLDLKKVLRKKRKKKEKKEKSIVFIFDFTIRILEKIIIQIN